MQPRRKLGHFFQPNLDASPITHVLKSINENQENFSEECIRMYSCSCFCDVT
jgi:hypothetical protein